MNIQRIQIWRLRLPLAKPYHLALGTLRFFESLIVKIQTDSQTGWGEITALPGYHRDSMDAIWRFHKKAVRTMIGKSPEEAFVIVSSQARRGFFRTTPIEMALEELLDPVKDIPDMCGTIPLVGVLELDRNMESQLNHLYASGCRTLKIKIGSHPLQELRYLRELKGQPLIHRFTLRFDANQSLDLQTAYRFCDSIQNLPTTLLEQPFPCGAWRQTAKLCEAKAVPIMLDESIYTREDIQKASAVGARWVKFKIGKQRTRRQMLELIGMAGNLGLGVIIGNGVATEIACRAEAAVWLISKQTQAGEMNGFRKLAVSLIASPYRVRNFSWKISCPLKLEVQEQKFKKNSLDYYEAISC